MDRKGENTIKKRAVDLNEKIEEKDQGKKIEQEKPEKEEKKDPSFPSEENFFQNDVDAEGKTITKLSDGFLKFLVGNTAPYLGRTYTLGKSTFSIGREKGQSLFIHSSMISRQHATIEKIDDDYFLTDNNSCNGTSLNDKALEPGVKCKLTHKDILKFDKYEFIFIDGENQTDFWESLRPLSRAGSQIISFYSPKGGTGITSICMNLSYDVALASKKKVVLADLNLRFGDVLSFTGVKFGGSIFDLVEDPTIDKNNIDESMFDFENFKILSCPRKIECADLVGCEHIQKAIFALQGGYDFLMIDLKNEIDDITLTVWEASNVIYLVTLPEIGHILAVRKVIDVMKKLKFPDSKVKVLVNRAGRPRTLDEEQINRWLGKEVTMLPDSPDDAFCTTQEQKLYVKENFESPLSKSLDHLAKVITGKEVEHKATDIFAKLRAIMAIITGSNR
ncbi:FHA domain-containing protein [bacterium]|nr:FHA domain-containing protein [bacterium]